jgi:hypothetical protein
MATIVATTLDGTVSGRMAVLVTQGDPKNFVGYGRCDPDIPANTHVVACSWTNGETPQTIPRSGVTRPVSVYVMREVADSCQLSRAAVYQQQVPDRLVVDTPGIVSYSNGIMTAVAPGSTSYTAYIGDMRCDPEVAPPRVTVGR